MRSTTADSNKITKNVVFSDLNLSFAQHPITKKLSVLKNNEAVKRALRNLILTNFYEVPYQPNFGGNVTANLFENFDNFTAYNVKKNIELAVQNYEPRVILLNVTVTPEIDNNSLNVNIVFRVVNQTQPIELNFLLQRVR